MVDTQSSKLFIWPCFNDIRMDTTIHSVHGNKTARLKTIVK